jgi:hypothetical protein
LLRQRADVSEICIDVTLMFEEPNDVVVSCHGIAKQHFNMNENDSFGQQNLCMAGRLFVAMLLVGSVKCFTPSCNVHTLLLCRHGDR